MRLRGEWNRVRSAIERHRRRRCTQKYIFELILLPRLRFPTDGTRAGACGWEGREDEGPNLYATANAAAIAAAACRITTVCHPDVRDMEEQGRWDPDGAA